jgi:hypothetical protein
MELSHINDCLFSLGWQKAQSDPKVGLYCFIRGNEGLAIITESFTIPQIKDFIYYFKEKETKRIKFMPSVFMDIVKRGKQKFEWYYDEENTPQ